MIEREKSGALELTNCLLTERINLWNILIKPLFEILIFPCYAERSKTNSEKVHTKIRRTFKKFCLLKKSVDNETIKRLMNYNFIERAGKVIEITKLKWNARIKHELPNKQDYPIRPLSVKTATLRAPLNISKNTIILMSENDEILDHIEIVSNEFKGKKNVNKKQIRSDIGSQIKIHVTDVQSLL